MQSRQNLTKGMTEKGHFSDIKRLLVRKLKDIIKNIWDIKIISVFVLCGSVKYVNFGPKKTHLGANSDRITKTLRWFSTDSQSQAAMSYLILSAAINWPSQVDAGETSFVLQIVQHLFLWFQSNFLQVHFHFLLKLKVWTCIWERKLSQTLLFLQVNKLKAQWNNRGAASYSAVRNKYPQAFLFCLSCLSDYICPTWEGILREIITHSLLWPAPQKNHHPKHSRNAIWREDE